MERGDFGTGIDHELAESIVSAARTSLGDTLRSVVYFTPSQFDVLYTRTDLYESGAEVRDAKSRLVDLEMMGFAEAPLRTVLTETSAPSSIGPYEFTVRFHEEGFVVRVVRGNHGVLLTTDAMDVNAFEETVDAFNRLLE
ncbi:hypothetical protein [Haladaptatus sp. DYSN1]|uniref:DUF7522 family protein n=1 Tax=unclassified Haladaptatus TaxID=2622732 RepID=UPI002405A09F|nr:hypothetical protein [Haladaptatus sp. DYSN1]